MAAQITSTGEIDRRIGFKLPCPRCGKTGDVHLNTRDPFGEKGFYCNGCRNTWGHVEMKTSVVEWSRVLSWLDILNQKE